MSFNTKKCKTLRSTTQKILSYSISKWLQTIWKPSFITHTSVLNLPSLKWSHHIDNITAKANRSLSFLQRNLWRFPAVKQQMHFALRLGPSYNIRHRENRNDPTKSRAICFQKLSKSSRYYDTYIFVSCVTKSVSVRPGLMILLNRSLSTGKVPTDMKIAKVVPKR